MRCRNFSIVASMIIAFGCADPAAPEDENAWGFVLGPWDAHSAVVHDEVARGGLLHIEESGQFTFAVGSEVDPVGGMAWIASDTLVLSWGESGIARWRAVGVAVPSTMRFAASTYPRSVRVDSWVGCRVEHVAVLRLVSYDLVQRMDSTAAEDRLVWSLSRVTARKRC